MEITMTPIKGITTADEEIMYQMLESLTYRFLHNQGSTSLPFWLDKFSSLKQGTRITMSLAIDGIIRTTVPKNNWAEVELNPTYLANSYSQEELDAMRRDTMLAKYHLDTTAPKSRFEGACHAKLPSGIQITGLVRTGFAKCSQHTFKYDTVMLTKYYDYVLPNAIKAMKELEKNLGYSLVLDGGYDYESTIVAVLNDVVSNDREYSLGKLTLDSRGRAIFNAVRKVFNPISNKFARSLVVMPAYTITPADLNEAYLFIAELVSGFDADIDRKIANGKAYYEARTMPSGNDDDFFEYIWVERIYNELDAYFIDNNHAFTTPIEKDFSSSNMVMIGLLLGHSDYVDHTRYMWQVDGLSKLHVKKAQTPYVFGSSAPISKLWKKAKLDYTAEQILIMKREQVSGKFAIANELKDIIIRHCQPKVTMNLKVMNESFTVECNRYKHVGDTTKQYVIYDSEDKVMKIITHTSTYKVPDLQQFKRYFVTGLIHNIDSQVMDNITKSLSWILPIHDAGLVSIAEARPMTELAVVQMQKLATNGEATLFQYFKSINLDSKGYERFAKLLTKVRKLNEDKELNITPYLLK